MRAGCADAGAAVDGIRPKKEASCQWCAVRVEAMRMGPSSPAAWTGSGLLCLGFDCQRLAGRSHGDLRSPRMLQGACRCAGAVGRLHHHLACEPQRFSVDDTLVGAPLQQPTCAILPVLSDPCISIQEAAATLSLSVITASSDQCGQGRIQVQELQNTV